MISYFNDVTTLEELRSQYKKLLKQYHPDNKGGSEDATKAINIEYEALFMRLKNVHATDKATNENTYDNNKYDWENDVVLREMLQKIINFNGIEIEIIGQWIWVFNAYICHNDLKSIGFKYAKNKKAWYFHTESFKKKSRKKLSINDIRNYYGGIKVQTTDNKLLVEA